MAAAQKGPVKDFIGKLLGKKKGKGPDVSCGIGGCDSEKLDELDQRKKRKKLYKTIEYTEKQNPPNQQKITTGHNTIETESTQTGYKTNYSGKTSDYKGSKSEEGKKGEQSYEGGNKGEGHTSKEIHTRYFKKRGAVGRVLTREKYKQIGGKIETQTSDQGKEGKIATVVYKGKNSKTKKGERSGKLEEKYGRTEKQRKAIPDVGFGKKAESDFERKKTSGSLEEGQYKLGEPGDKKKEIKTSRSAFREDIKKKYKQYKKV